MTSTDAHNDDPAWKKQFVEDVYRHLLQFAGQTYDTSIIEYAVNGAFARVQSRLEGVPEEKRQEKITEEWVVQLAEEAFLQQLFHWLSVDPALHFDLLYTVFAPKLRLYIASLLHKPKDDHEVEECLQDTFIKIFQSLINKARRHEMLVYPFTGWLYSVAKSICQDYYEKQNRRQMMTSLEQHTVLQQQDDERQQPDMYAEARERDEKVRLCVDRLPEPCRSCVQLFYFQALPLAEIAQRLDIPLSRVKTCIYQLAERHFRKLWRQEYDAEA